MKKLSADSVDLKNRRKRYLAVGSSLAKRDNLFQSGTVRKLLDALVYRRRGPQALLVILPSALAILAAYWVGTRYFSLGVYPQRNLIPLFAAPILVGGVFALRLFARYANGSFARWAARLASTLTLGIPSLVLASIVLINVKSYSFLDSLDSNWMLRWYDDYSLEHQARYHPNPLMRTTRLMFYRLRDVMKGGVLVTFDQEAVPMYYMDTIVQAHTRVEQYDPVLSEAQIAVLKSLEPEALQLMQGKSFLLVTQRAAAGEDARYRLLVAGDMMSIVPETIFQELRDMK